MASTYTINSTTQLLSGYKMPRLGFGVFETPPEDTEAACLEAFKAAYRHIDSAVWYKNEAAVGAAIKKSGIPRDQIFFTTKIPLTLMSYEQAKAQVDKSLADAGLDYIDLMLVHSPYGGSAARKGVWRALVEAVEEGKIRSIGVSNYGIHHLDQLEQHIVELEAERGGKGRGGVISVGQWEVHPWCARADIVEWCVKRGVVVEAYCPLVRGQRFDEPVLVRLAEKYNKTPAQVLIRWSLQKGHVPLPKSVTPTRIRSNAQVFDFHLSVEDMAALETDDYANVSWDPTQSSLEGKLF